MAWNEPGGNQNPWGGSGGRGGSQSSPDVEQLIKRLRARFGGGKGGDGGAGGGSGGKGPLAGAATVIVVIVALLWLASGFYIVDERQQGVVLQFGNFSRVTEPGLRWHIPWPVQKVETINVTEIREVSDRSAMLTEDENIVEMELRVQYRISGVQDYVFNIRNPDDVLRQATRSALREIVGESTLDIALVDGRADVANRTRDNLQQMLDEYGAGLFVTNVNLTDARAPGPVQDAFLDAIKAREDHERLVDEAEAYANDRIPRARGEAAREKENARAYRDRIVARAEGDASRFTQLVEAVQRDPEITRERLYLETMSEVLASSGKVLVDVDGSGSLIMMPLEEMLKGVKGGESVRPSTTLPAIGGSTALPGSSGSDARSRERGRR